MLRHTTTIRVNAFALKDLRRHSRRVNYRFISTPSSSSSSSSSSLYSTPSRRKVLTDIFQSSAIIIPVILLPSTSANAGEIGTQINRAVTTSDLGITVRRSVVKGAQIMDKVDKQWELFSDNFGLGAARYDQGKRPTAKVIPPLLPLDVATALQILTICDEVFCDVVGIADSTLQSEIDKIQTLVKPAFQSAGVVLDSTIIKENRFETGPQFDFASYARFRAYSNLLVSNKVEFRSFKREFEQNCGRKMLNLLLQQQQQQSMATSMNSSSSQNTNNNIEVILKKSLQDVQTLTRILRDKGLLAASEIGPSSLFDSYQFTDFINDSSSDLQLSLALDGDVTIKSQMLLQEQGYNLIPNYARFMIRQLLVQQLNNNNISLTMEEYYMDTNYNSNPDLYEAKEVLINIELERK